MWPLKNYGQKKREIFKPFIKPKKKKRKRKKKKRKP